MYLAWVIDPGCYNPYEFSLFADLYRLREALSLLVVWVMHGSNTGWVFINGMSRLPRSHLLRT